jgi:hypothetical protein
MEMRLAAAPPNPPLQRSWSSLTLGATPLNGKVVGRTRNMAELAAFICGHVFDKSRPVLLASHDGGDWQLLCGGDHEAGDRPHVVGLHHLLDRDPSLRDILDLPVNWDADRVDAVSPWVRKPSPVSVDS